MNTPDSRIFHPTQKRSRQILAALATPGLTASEAVVYAYYVGRANRSHVCSSTIDDTVTGCGGNLCERTVQTSNAALAAKGLIRIERRHAFPSSKIILDPDGRLYGGRICAAPGRSTREARP